MEKIIKQYGLAQTDAVQEMKRSIGVRRIEVKGLKFRAIHNDCIEELEAIPVKDLQKVYRQFSRSHIYNYEEHVKLANELDKNGKLPASFMVVAPGSWNESVWDDINRMKTLNTQQRLKRKQMHLFPLQLDIVERLVDRYSNPGEIVLDPFGGLMTVPLVAVKKDRKGIGIELNPDYFRDGLGYLKTEEAKKNEPTLFDFLGVEEE